MTREQIEQAEAERLRQHAEEVSRLMDEDRQRQLREHDEAAYQAFRTRYPDASREVYERFTATQRTARKALEEEMTPRPPDAFSRAMEEQRRRESQARIEARVKSEAEMEARRKASEEELERALAPDKVRVQREWLANHPGKTAQDFDRYAWPELRFNIIADKQQELAEQQAQALRISGHYSDF